MNRPDELTILGGGSWGTALAVSLAGNFSAVNLRVHDPVKARAMQETRENRVYLPGLRLPDNIAVSSDARVAGWVLVAIPSKHLVQGLPPAEGAVAAISAVKGIEAESFRTMTEVIGGFWPTAKTACLSGPTFAKEVAAGLPAAVVVASEDEDFARAIQGAFGTASLRLYTNSDLRGVELSGALKNCIAVAAGAVEGLGVGSNSMAALITRGLAEMGRLVAACGGQAQTVAGLAGLGDLVLTCHGQLSRNRRVGVELAKGRALEAILADSPMIPEAVTTVPVALELARSKGVEMPITQAVAKMFGGIDTRQCLRELVERAPKAEI